MAVIAPLVLVLALAAAVLGECHNPPAVDNLDSSEILGTWKAIAWPKKYNGKYKCGNQTLERSGDVINYVIHQYNVTAGAWETSHGHISETGHSGRYHGERVGLDNNVNWDVVGISPGKWLVYHQCRVDIGSEIAIALYKDGVTLTPEEKAAAIAALPGPADLYSECPE
ncbi:uncharacterized protein LOC134537370 [Bacillus rossius redtenbacheri]|uniref:uncharacterized protein LOC134537369 n=1 Tax=Bacillus rossius redtenbacheri TaxID=93214 RepID=UPI002FDE4089